MNRASSHDLRISGRRWQHLRRIVLLEEPLCRICKARGIVRQSDEVDHVKPLQHGGKNDRENLQGLCVDCHKEKSRAEANVTVVGVDGVPVGWDTGAWQPGRADRMTPDLMFPSNIEPPTIPVTLVCGPPAGGKTAYVRAHALPDDEVIDLDEILRGWGMAPRSASKAQREQGLAERNRRLRALAWYHGPAERAWFITTAAPAETRERWARLMRSRIVVVLMPSEAVCVARIDLDRERRRAWRSQRGLIRRWFMAYTPRPEDEVNPE